MLSPTVSSALSKTTLAAPHLSHVYLFADDLTGASDAAAAFLSAGHSVRVWFGSKALHSTAESVQAFNTNSRSLSPQQAALAVSRAVAGLQLNSNAFFFKKIDSAARGPLGSEVLAAHRLLGTEAILLAPSFPAAGRTVSNGILYIQDAAGQLTQISLIGLFPPEIRPLIAIIALPDEIVPALASGKSILVCDALTQTDLEGLARGSAGLNILYAGSAGLAKAIASLDPAPLPPQPLPLSERTLIVAGTQHLVTRLQLDHLTGENPSAQLLRICWEAGDDARIRAEFERLDPQALILTGGETALAAVRALDAHSSILHGEIAPGIPWGILQGGPADGRVIITKSGGFGSSTTLSDILATLSGQA
jgi:uncharacterized protein YgbK (DUF1537 family)